MKKSVFTGLFIFLVCGLILSACFSPWKGGDEVEIVINFTGGSGSGRSVTLDQLKYIVTLSGNNETITIEENGGGAIRATVSVGHWNVKIDAYLNEELYATGSNSVDVKAGQNNYVTIKIIPVTVQNDIDAQTPVITSQPQSAVYTVNATATELSVTAEVTDGGILSYQWYSNDTNDNTSGELIEGADDDNYIPPTDTEKTVYYYVIITNTNEEAAGNKTAAVTSETAQIIVDNHVHALPPVISEHPHHAEYTINKEAMPLTVTASVADGGELSYQWYRNAINSNSDGTLINGATSASFTPSTAVIGTVYYYVAVTNTIPDNGDGGNKTALTVSNPAEIEINDHVNAQSPVISEHPHGDVEYTINAVAAALTVTASVEDGGTLSYQWYSHNMSSNSGGTLINGATSASYTPPTNTAGTVYYYVEVTNTIADNGDGGNKTATTNSHTAKIITHEFSTTWTYNATQHWRECTVEGCEAKIEIANHYEYEWTITIGATEANNGVEISVQTCATCGETTGTPRVSTAGLSYTLISGKQEYEAAAGTVTSGAVIIASKYEGLPVTAIAAAAGSAPNFTGSFAQTAITSVIIPDGVETIGDRAFYECPNLTSVTLSDSLKTIGNLVFRNCAGITSITIPNSVISIGNAFYGTGLTSVTIPASVTSIQGGTFARCSSLTGIEVSADNPNYSSQNGVLYNKDKTTLVLAPGASSGSFTIPNSVKSIGDNAFSGCAGLTTITIPNSVTSIGNTAFRECSGITDITIPNSVTSIGDSAFYEFASLTSVTIGTGIASIGTSAFWSCVDLISVTIYAETPPVLGVTAFGSSISNNNPALQFKVPSSSVGAYQSASRWSEYSSKITAITP